MNGPALLLGLLVSAAPPGPAAPAPLCHVRAVSAGIPMPPLRVIIVGLRPGCPPNGHALIRLVSDSGATDPADGYAELNNADPSMTYRGVLPGWKLVWKAQSERYYTVPEGAVRGGGS